MIGIYDITGDFKFNVGGDIKLFNVGDVVFPKIDGLYIDWVGNWRKSAFTFQAMLIEKYIKNKIPVVIYDRYMCMTWKEYEYLKKFNTYFFEPAINNRSEFDYLPQWTNMLSMEDFNILEVRKRNIDLAYGHALKNRFKSFEKYYQEFSEHSTNRNIVYSDGNIHNDKIRDFKNSNLKLVKSYAWDDVRFTVCIDMQKNYDIGYLDPYIFMVMSKGCVPLIPIEHRYFGSIGMTIKNFNDMRWLIESEQDIKEIIIEDIYKSIEMYYPEFTMEYAEDKLKRCFV